MNEPRVLFVGGTWDDEKGKCSSLMASMMSEANQFFGGLTYHNGGPFEELRKIVENAAGYHAIIWMPNVPNDMPKLVGELKRVNPTALLVVSKRNDNNEYSFAHLVARALQVKANMFVEICKGSDGRFVGGLFDSLSNMWDETDDFVHLTKSLCMRIQQLLCFTRVRSHCTGPAKEIPNDQSFFTICREFGERFHELIQGTNTFRFLGNMAFRCERGFPAFVQDGVIYVSRRNIDKRHITRSGFVALDVGQSIRQGGIFYYGEHKPSVDAPTQLGLFKWYSNVRYMMHSHVYIETAPLILAPMTEEAMPCGAIEECEAILDLFPDQETELVRVNLRGHGSLVVAKDMQDIYETQYVARPRPELQDVTEGKDVLECRTYSLPQIPTS